MVPAPGATLLHVDWRTRYGPWAVITGASSGLGREYATQLAAKGLGLVLVARREDRVQALAEELSARHGIRADAVVADLLEDAGLARVQALASEREVGLLVNNAGFGWVGRFLEADPQTFRRMTRLNCEVPTLLAHSFLEPMAARGHGGMILVASLSSFQPTPYMTTYGASKSYALSLGESLAVEMGPRGLDILTVCPGSTDTEFQKVAEVPPDQAAKERRDDPAMVIQGSLARLGRRHIYIPGARKWGLTFAQRFAPRALVRATAARVLSKRLR